MGFPKGFEKGIGPDISREDRSYWSIFEMIITKRLQGPIVQARLAEWLAVPRSSIDGALGRLERDGFIMKGDNRSPVVRQVERAEYLQAAHVRELLEGEAAALAAGSIPKEEIGLMRQALGTAREFPANLVLHWRLDEDLHDLIGDHCGNPVIASILRAVRITMWLYGPKPYETRQGLDRRDIVYVEHLGILDALERGDPIGARKVVIAHVKDNLRQKLGKTV